MMVLYNIGIYVMTFAIWCAGLFSPKARKWTAGRRGLVRTIEGTVDRGAATAWFHAASLGEFEQARPVIEAFKVKYPDHKILVTFFSPSGYEIRRNYPGADYVFYLPADTRRNARRFVEAVNPKIAIFIKYEFWANYLHRLRRSGTRTYIVSAIFRPGSTFFKWYGGWYRGLLRYFDRIFVQDAASAQLLSKAGIENVTVAGDTRFDRVAKVAAEAKELPSVEAFAGGSTVFVAGSTWAPDEELLLKMVEKFRDVKFIIAAHEIDGERIERFRSSITRHSARYTEAGAEDMASAEVLFIDTIGILSSVYRYGDYAYIGGGFGVGIHNILEAAAFGLPLSFGPNYRKFKEAVDLIAAGGAVSVNDAGELEKWFTKLRGDKDGYGRASAVCGEYVREGAGATAVFMKWLEDRGEL